MKPVFANSAWVSAPEWAVIKRGGLRKRRLQVRYGFFHHPDAGPVLIDTGYSAETTKAPGRSTVLRIYNSLLRPVLNPDGQFDRLGVAAMDIKTVIVTHFHADHVSGLRNFPNARFLASGAAWKRISSKSHRQNLRHGIFTELLPEDFADRLHPIEEKPSIRVSGLPTGFDLFADGSVAAIPLPGHADGHFGLYFRECRLLYATDTQWLSEALPEKNRPSLLPRLISQDAKAAAVSSDCVAQFQASGNDVLLCHDDAPSNFDAAVKK